MLIMPNCFPYFRSFILLIRFFHGFIQFIFLLLKFIHHFTDPVHSPFHQVHGMIQFFMFYLKCNIIQRVFDRIQCI